ncbi:MAG: alginate lyase family protein [Phycisphaerae bacterium]|nr:alginate lyase family protein [Phycisphaerae bacterium]
MRRTVRKPRIVVCAAIVMLTGLNSLGAEPTSIEGVCKACPERITKLFGSLNLDRPGLTTVKMAVAAKDWPAACSALLAYYRGGKFPAWLREGPVSAGTGKSDVAEAILRDEITCYRLTAKVPRLPNGRLNWSYNGPNDDREWGWGLNRHYHLRALHAAYRGTGNPAYLKCLDEHIRDWVISNPYPGKKSSTPQWRGLEAFMRILAWAQIFYGLQQEEGFTPAARILILSSLPDHADYARHFHASGGNWVTMEMYGLATAGVCWPEFEDAEAWIDYAVKRTVPELTKQVYPDGVQKELTASYHRVAMDSFQHLADLLRNAGRDVPTVFRAPLERMNNYVAYAMRPDGHGPLNNDSDLDSNRPRVLAAAKVYDRSDWVFIATNGKQGKRPEGGPSVVFPYAGQVVMRSDWDADAHWAFFDVGPLGIGHWHYDKLHLSVAAYGRDLLVDAGRYSYKGDEWRRYFVGSAGHNVILVDGRNQKPEVKEVSEPMKGNFVVSPAYDFARGTFDKGFADVPGKVVHTRAVLYARGRYWVVVDRIDTDRPRTIQSLWHFHPDCTVVADGASLATTDPGKGNLRVIPVSNLAWQVEFIRGQTAPAIQGWYSREYNVKTPNSAASYTARIDKPVTFAWVLVPAKGVVPEVRATMLGSSDPSKVELRIQVGHAAPQEVAVPMYGTNVVIR